MPSFGEKSLERLSTCHPKLRQLMGEVIQHIDFSIICGARNEADQEEAFRTGKSKVHYPNSAHNKTPSLAVDIVPYPVDWSNPKPFYYLAGFVMATAARLGMKIRWGGNFDGDYSLTNDKFIDLPHFELVE